ncbi:MAG: FAD-dependent monooxygenase [Acidobacteriia bacterium]|nr:FAD-dependent monooxygenase [Terriglobia bacterium]
MHTDAVDTDILLAEAEPVGLFLANECARHGLRWRLIEATGSQSKYCKALAIFPRTLEIFDRPDGPIAYSAHNGGILASLASMQSLLESQTRSTPFVSPARP